MSSPFNPRDVEVLAAALPPQAANPIGRLTRDIFLKQAKQLTPSGHPRRYSASWKELFFPNSKGTDLGPFIAIFTGLDDAFFTDLVVAMLCQQMANVTTKLKPDLLTDKIANALATFNDRIHQNSYRFYGYMAATADSPIRPALAAFPDEPSKKRAKEHYLEGLTSPTWVNEKLLQWGQGNWSNRDWELFHHFIKLSVLGASVAEIDQAIAKLKGMGLPVPPTLDPGVWHKRAIWLERDFGAADAVEATPAILAHTCIGPVVKYRICKNENDAFEFTAQKASLYRKTQSSSCFAPGTKVVMADASLRPIEQIAIGDNVQTPAGPRQVLLRSAPLRGNRIMVQFSGTKFAFSTSHPFLVAPSGSASAAYAAADPDGLARNVPTLSQFGIQPLNGQAPAVLLRHTAGGDMPFPAPAIHDVSGPQADLVYDLFLDVGPDGRSEYYVGDDQVQLLVSSEVPRFAAAPETTAVVLHVLQQAGPTILEVLAKMPDWPFEELLAIGLDSLSTTMMATIGPQLRIAPDSAPQAPLRGLDSAAELASAVRDFAGFLAAAGEDDRRHMGQLVEQFASRFAPQFQAVLAMPWRTFDLASGDVANMLAVTPYSIDLFRPGPPVDQAEIEVSLVRGRSRSTHRLPVAPGAPADRWYYGVDASAYFPEWAPPGPVAGWQPEARSEDEEEDMLWQLELTLQPDAGCRAVLILPRDIGDGYQQFRVPVTGAHGETVGQALLDVRLLTLENYAAEIQAHNGKTPCPSATSLADRLARLAADFVEANFREAVEAFKDCALKTFKDAELTT